MRLTDWQPKLAAYIIEAKATPFQYGAHDCALFSANCIKIETGRDPASTFRGAYFNYFEAYRLLRQSIYSNKDNVLELFAADLAAEMEFKEIGKYFAGAGDVVLCDQDGKDTMGIIDLTGRAVMIASECGLIWHTFSVIKRAWKVD